MKFNFYAVKKFEDPAVMVKIGPHKTAKAARAAGKGIKGARVVRIRVIPLHKIKVVKGV